MAITHTNLLRKHVHTRAEERSRYLLVLLVLLLFLVLLVFLVFLLLLGPLLLFTVTMKHQ